MTYYQNLGIPEDASDDEIKKAYQRLIEPRHSNTNPTSATVAAIQRLNEAYEVLSDPVKRAQYDAQHRHTFITKKPNQETSERMHGDAEVSQHDKDEHHRLAEHQRKRGAKKHEQRQAIYRVVRILNIPVVLFSLGYLFDAYVPFTRNTTINSGWRVAIVGSDTVTYLRTNHVTFELPAGVQVNYDYEHDAIPMPVQFTITPIRHVIKSATIKDGNRLVQIPMLPPGYQNDVIWIVPLLLCSAFVVWRKDHTEMLYPLAFVSLGMVVPAWIFLIESHAALLYYQ